MIMAKKGYNYPIKKKIPLILLLNLFGITTISHILWFVNIFRKILSLYLPGGKKRDYLAASRRRTSLPLAPRRSAQDSSLTSKKRRPPTDGLLFWRSGRDLRTQLRGFAARLQSLARALPPRMCIPYLLPLLPSWVFLRLLSLKQTNSANKKSHPIGWLFLWNYIPNFSSTMSLVCFL